MPDLEELKQTMEATRATLSRLQAERDEKKRRLVAVEERRILSEVTVEYGARISDAAKVARDANLAYCAALEAHAKTGAGCSVPLGTKMVHWSNRPGYHRIATQVPDISGVVEVVTLDSLHGNIASYHQAAIGDFIIRHLRKDGTPGVRYDRFTRPWVAKWDAVVDVNPPYGWHPEGVDPNVKTEAAK